MNAQGLFLIHRAMVGNHCKQECLMQFKKLNFKKQHIKNILKFFQNCPPVPETPPWDIEGSNNKNKYTRVGLVQ